MEKCSREKQPLKHSDSRTSTLFGITIVRNGQFTNAKRPIRFSSDFDSNVTADSEWQSRNDESSINWTALEIVMDVISELAKAERRIFVTGNVPFVLVTDPGMVTETPDV
jgi:hypothetical protein